jgi:sensor c-di-GMP phosphodiesterase-like protein
MLDYDEIIYGLENAEFFLEYMPTIRLKDKKCVGAESLIRWYKNDQIIQPLEFIPLVENTPASELLTCWVVEEIGRELGQWLHENDDVHLGINIPPEIIGRGGIVNAVKKAGLLDVTEKFIFEITERGVPDQIAIEALDSAKGIHVAVDDFGTGDLNLLDLSKLDIHVIKIDKHFIDEIVNKDSSPKMIRGLIALAREFEAVIIAEGVETEIQVSKLEEFGVDMVQGWFFSKSLPAEAFIKFFNEKQKGELRHGQ